MKKTNDEKIEFVHKIIFATENKRTQRYFNEIMYINNLRRNNHKLYEANISLVDRLKDKITKGK